MIKPWDINPDLQPNYLSIIAEMLTSVTADVVDLHDEELGDTFKSLGLRAYECLRTAIRRARYQYNWLNVITEDGRFTFTIGSTPIRFWTGSSPEKLPSGKLIRSEEALQQLELLPIEEPTVKNLVWFCVLSRNRERFIHKAHFVAYNEVGQIYLSWEAPIRGSITKITEISHSKPEAVELESAVNRIKPRTPKVKDSQNEK